MTSILRQSSTLARISKSSLQSAARSNLRTSNYSPLLASRISVQQSRLFASQPKKPKKDDGAQRDSEVTNKKASEAPSKPAPGTENLYNGKTPLTKDEGSAPSEPPLADGMTRLNAEDQKAMEELLETLKKGLPKGQVEIIERSLEAIKKEGIPKELKEVMDEVRGKPMTLATAAKLTRLTSQMARKQAERDMGSQRPNFQSNDPKGAGSPPPGGDKKS